MIGCSAGDDFPAAGAIAARKLALAPTRRVSHTVRHDPDLEQRGCLVLKIVLGMDDAGPCAHHLDIAGSRTALVAKAVLMGNCPGAYEGYDFHVVMGMRRKAAARADRIVIPDSDRTPAYPRRIMIGCKAEVVSGIQPAVVRVAQASKGSYFDHGCNPPRRDVNAGTSHRWETGWLNQPSSPCPSAR